MKKYIFLFAAFVLFSGHDMFFKMDSYFLNPNTPATIELFNGTFDISENTIARSRMNDVCLVGNGTRTNADTSQWTEMGNTTILNFKTGEAGTWVAGLSTNPNNIELTAEEFNEYLEHDGVNDMYDWRKKNNTLGKNAVEKYSKHVKSIFQVGDKKTNDWQTFLGYPIEFVPMSNPYNVKAGDELQVKLLWKGQPLANQFVYVNSDSKGHSHGERQGQDHDEIKAEEGHRHDATKLLTNANGIVTINLANEGQWYLRTIYMIHSEESGLTHESNWATLTFEVGHGTSHADSGHGHEGHDHGEAHSHSHGIPSYFYWIGCLVLLAGLFFWLRWKN